MKFIHVYDGDNLLIRTLREYECLNFTCVAGPESLHFNTDHYRYQIKMQTNVIRPSYVTTIPAIVRILLGKMNRMRTVCYALYKCDTMPLSPYDFLTALDPKNGYKYGSDETFTVIEDDGLEKFYYISRDNESILFSGANNGLEKPFTCRNSCDVNQGINGEDVY